MCNLSTYIIAKYGKGNGVVENYT